MTAATAEKSDNKMVNKTGWESAEQAGCFTWRTSGSTPGHWLRSGSGRACRAVRCRPSEGHLLEGDGALRDQAWMIDTICHQNIQECKTDIRHNTKNIHTEEDSSSTHNILLNYFLFFFSR